MRLLDQRYQFAILEMFQRIARCIVLRLDHFVFRRNIISQPRVRQHTPIRTHLGHLPPHQYRFIVL